MGDREKLAQAFGRLLDRAAYHSRDGELLKVELAAIPGSIRFTVNYAKQTSDEASQGSQEQALHPSLEPAQRILDMHRGQLWTEDLAGGRAQLTASLPALEPGAGKETVSV